jgi:hypothetical protein
VDDQNGSDTNPGRSSAAPWRTLNRIQTAKLLAGDYVLLRRGGHWNESLTIDSSGNADTPLYFGAYGEGAKPIVEGQFVPQDGLVRVTQAAYVNISNWSVRGNSGHGVEVYVSNNVKLRDMEISNNRRHGVLIYNSDNVSVEDSRIAANGADPAGRFAGIAIDGNGGDWSGFLIRGNTIADHNTGEGWLSCNGISLGHTGQNIPAIRAIRIVANTIDRNGNPNQNQAGRGITGSFNGDIEVSRNTISNSASAGLYLGDYGLAIDITIRQNLFLNNQLRQFGGTTSLRALAENNTVLVNDANATAMGAEMGGKGRWTLQSNTFIYLTDTSDTFRGFVRLNDTDQIRLFKSDFNVFYSAGPRRWFGVDDQPLDFRAWQNMGFDRNSAAPVQEPR